MPQVGQRETAPINTQVAQLFRRLTRLCLLGIGANATLTYADIFTSKVATMAIAILALLLFLNVIDALPLLPGKGMIKVYLRLRLR